jgi:hypothetical protein
LGYVVFLGRGNKKDVTGIGSLDRLKGIDSAETDLMQPDSFSDKAFNLLFERIPSEYTDMKIREGGMKSVGWPFDKICEIMQECRLDPIFMGDLRFCQDELGCGNEQENGQEIDLRKERCGWRGIPTLICWMFAAMGLHIT